MRRMKMELTKIKSCPYCGCTKPTDHYVYIECPECGFTGIKTNGGRNDASADNVDHARAVELWNSIEVTHSANMKQYVIYNGNYNREHTKAFPTEEAAWDYVNKHWDEFPGDPSEIYVEVIE
jgi:predicted RNA-binding Zn-ribbon protein involved in translation (DUF1610 family)